MSNIPKYSIKDKKGASFLKRHYNDIEVFVEDKKCSNMWVNLINITLQDIAKIESVTQLGDKLTVIKECKNDNDFSYPKIYIIDGDFDFIFNSKIKNERLFRLNVYCVENLLFSENAFLELIFQLDSNKPKGTLKEELNFVMICDYLRKNWGEWYLLASIVYYYKIKNIHEELTPNVSQYFQNKNRLYECFNCKRIRTKLNKFKKCIENNIGKDELIKKISLVKSILKKKNIDILRIISAKDCLITYILHFLHKNYKYGNTKDVLKVQLAAYTAFDLDKNFYNSFREKCAKILGANNNVDNN
jgi:hypothetical protein